MISYSNIISWILIAFLARSTHSQSCCDFSSYYYCEWVYVNDSWHVTPFQFPNTILYYPGFQPPFDPNYAWIQDKSGTMKSVNNISISSASTGFHFDYYLDSPTPMSGDSLKFVFYPPGGPDGIDIAVITKQEDKWQHYTAPCDGTNSFCCGSKDEIPCAGNVEIVATLDPGHNLGLFAVDNLCGDGDITTPTYYSTTPTSIAPTTKSPITLPPPHGGDTCCRFDDDVCGYSSTTYWYWSVDLSPPVTIPNSDNGYLWSNTDGSFVETEILTNIAAETSFSMSYFINSPSTVLDVYFQDNGGSTSLVASLGYVDGNWQTAWLQSYSYCNIGSTCAGSFRIQLTGNDVAAIDNTDMDGACGSSFPCCYFDDPNFCNLDFAYPQEWLWSGNSIPTFNVPAPPSLSDFIYFETINYVGPANYSTLSSQLLLIKRSSVFKATIYVYTPKGADGYDELRFNFREESTQITTTLDFARTTYGSWVVDVEFPCQSMHGDCCQTAIGNDCNGTLEITAFVEQDGGSVFYGIDSIYIDDKCHPLTPTTIIPTTTPTTTTTLTTTTPTTTTQTTPTPTTTTPTTTTPTTTTPTTTTPTTTTPITLPPPHGGNTCCHFDTDVCGFYSENLEWNWSKDEQPPTSIPNADNDYMWTETDGSVLKTQLFNVTPETTFSMSYFISSPPDQLLVYFNDNSGNRQLLKTLNYTNEDWLSAYIQGFSWCAGSFCSGQFEVQSSGSEVSAIDDTEINGGCGGSLPCCYFDKLSICDFENDFSGLWKWSGSSTPLFPVPAAPSNSTFIYFEEQDYVGPEENATLSSNRIYISADSTFTAMVYIETPAGDAGEDALYFMFTEESTGITTVMDFGKTTNDRWISTTIYCSGMHGNCCQDVGATCYGQLQIQGHVQQSGGTVFYGLDSIEIDNQCPAFPGFEHNLFSKFNFLHSFR